MFAFRKLFSGIRNPVSLYATMAFSLLAASQAVDKKLNRPILCANQNVMCATSKINPSSSYVPFYSQEQMQQVAKKYPFMRLLDQNLISVQLSILRLKETGIVDFRYYANRILRILLETALGNMPMVTVKEMSPLCQFDSKKLQHSGNIVAVTILRGGNSFLSEIMQIIPDINVGMILVQRNEKTQAKEAVYYYSKLPTDIAEKQVLLLDPMLATGGSAVCAVEELKRKGVKEENIVGVFLIAVEQGIQKLYQNYPKMKIIVGTIDPLMNEQKYIVPGLGDFGDRYFGTPH